MSEKKEKDFWLTSLFRHQIAGAIAFLVDFVIFVILTDLVDIWYVPATALAALVGAVLNFTLSTKWSFPGSKNSLKSQMLRYIIVSAGSIVLNTILVYLFTELVGLNEKISKLITAALVGSIYNFLLMRNYVFKK